ncbi:P-loop containing nucleoside triphosphate hydrolase protein [Aspergillus alliaceus]|uniref:P-loop containing nucleoside triphosphate hydrolase protein n=1 Tax=Petromyces alliaceus TaxID=209559 RepID=A0A5N7BYL0_PETAA|nr:P-loop containing nucleoside triphosphate hydrolase protein [Aspergillus alliaceus]
MARFLSRKDSELYHFHSIIRPIEIEPLLSEIVTYAGRITLLFWLNYRYGGTGQNFIHIFNFWSRFSKSFDNVSNRVSGFTHSIEAEHVFQVLYDYTGETQSEGDQLLESDGSIDFQDVCVTYNKNTFALRNISFSVKPGQTIAIVGRNGAGKSTILRTLMRLIDHDSGDIKISNHDIRRLTKESVREHIKMVPQNPELFYGQTILTNLTYGCRPDIDYETVQEICKHIGLHERILSFTRGYQTELHPSNDLSGGQKQIVALVRILLQKPSILALDEATSQLDKATEKTIWNYLDTIQKTKIIVTHRLQKIKNADQILVVEQGQIVGRGTHKELLGNEIYRLLLGSV